MTDTPNASGEPDELYLDAAATEPVTRNVIEAMMPFMTDAYANPASVHQPGKTAARALDAARASFAAGLGARLEHRVCSAVRSRRQRRGTGRGRPDADNRHFPGPLEGVEVHASWRLGAGSALIAALLISRP